MIPDSRVNSVFDPIEHDAVNELRWPAWWGWSLSLLALAWVMWVDTLTGYEVSVMLLYALPVGLAAWMLDARAGAVLAVLSALAWFWSDWLVGHQYSHDWIRVVNAINRVAYFLLIAAVVRHVLARRRVLAARRGSPVGVCARCDQWGASDGAWRTHADHLTEWCQVKLDHKVCPDCARRVYARAGYRSESPQS